MEVKRSSLAISSRFAEVLGQALLQDRAELLPERGVLLRLLLRHVGQQPEHLLGRVGPDVVHHAAALQQLAGDVQRQVGRVDHAADEPQVLRHQLAGVLQHEDPPDVQLDAPPGLRDPQVEGGAGRDEQQQRVLVGPLDLAVHPGQRVGEVTGHVPVEVLVVLLGELALGPRPQRGGLVDRGFFAGLTRGIFLRRHHDGQADVVGVLLDDAAQPVVAEQVVFALAQVQHDRGAPVRLLDRLQRVRAPAVRGPADALRGGQAGPPGGQRDPVGHDERGVEADPELPDERRVLALVAGQGGQELPGPRLGDGPDVVDDLLAAHADPVVGHGDRPGVFVVADPDLQRALGLGELGVREQLEPEPVDGVGGVRDQLAEEDLLVAVQRMHHQVQDLDHFGLEAEALLRVHAGTLPAGVHAPGPFGPIIVPNGLGASLTGCRGRSRQGFRWGVATSGHQTEGGNTGSDTWFLEHVRPTVFREPSGAGLQQLRAVAGGRRPGGRARPGRLPVLRRMGQGRAGRGRVLRRGPGALPRDRRPLCRGGDRTGGHLQPLHRAALVRAARRVARPGRLRRCSPGTAAWSPSTWATARPGP